MGQCSKEKGWRRYYLIGGGLLFSGLVLAGLVVFWDEIQGAAGYGYAGCFVITLVAGMTVVPAPGLAVVFTLGHKLSPMYVGLVAGLGEAVGGAAIYLTGAGGGTIWSRLRGKRQSANVPLDPEDVDVPLLSHGFQSKWRAFFDRIVAPMRRWGSSWPVFIAAATLFSPFYVIGLGAGALGMGLRKFFLVSWAGKTVKALYVAFAGHWGLYFLLQWLGG